MVRTLWRLLAVAAVGTAVWSLTASAQLLPANPSYLCRKVKDLKLPQKFVPQPGFGVRDEVGVDTCDLRCFSSAAPPLSSSAT